MKTPLPSNKKGGCRQYFAILSGSVRNHWKIIPGRKQLSNGMLVIVITLSRGRKTISGPDTKLPVDATMFKIPRPSA